MTVMNGDNSRFKAKDTTQLSGHPLPGVLSRQPGVTENDSHPALSPREGSCIRWAIP